MRINHVEVIFHIQVFYRLAAENLSCAKDNIEVRNGRKLGRGSRKKWAWPPVLPNGLRWITSCLAMNQLLPDQNGRCCKETESYCFYFFFNF